MTEIKIEIDTSALNIEAVRDAIAHPAPILKLMAERHLLNVDNNFKNEAGADGGWKPLSTAYRKRKEKHPRAIQKTLQFSGLMRAGINYDVAGDSVSIGSDKIYAPKHEATRPFLKPSDRQIEQFGDIASDYLANL